MATLYRADQIGSLLCPPELLQARMAHDQGGMTLEQLRQVEDQAIAAGNPLSWDEQRQKLALVVETARRAWG